MADDILKNIPLPADLPENWTSGQIIAPTGAEAGLDDQHGYNYLMKQVNNAQRALKALAAQREEDLARIKFWASNDPTSPASFIGGTWERIEGKFIMGASDTYPAGATGGEESVKLTRKNIPILSTRNGVAAVNIVGNAIHIPQWGWIYEATQIANSDGYNSYTAQWTDVGTDDVDMQNVNNMPPYIAVYIWRRVA